MGERAELERLLAAFERGLAQAERKKAIQPGRNQDLHELAAELHDQAASIHDKAADMFERTEAAVSDDKLGRIEVRQLPVPSLALIGEFDLSNADALRACLSGLREEGMTRVTLDLSEATFVDSTTINRLVDAHNGGLSVTIVGAIGAVLRTFQVAGVDAVLNFE